MLQTLTITNYVIIDHAQISFSHGLNMVTGETGAGKSILLGALSLVLGERAETQVLFDPSTKAVVEAVFLQPNARVKGLLEQNDLDQNPEVVLRREITPNGRTRAFINDSPVTLNLLSSIGSLLVDVHQQFETLEIQTAVEQFRILDAFCASGNLVLEYQKSFQHFLQLQSQLESLRLEQSNALKEKDYLLFQLNEFDQLQIEKGGIDAMEEEYQLQNDADELKTVINSSEESISGEGGIADHLRSISRNLSRYSAKNVRIHEFLQRIQSVLEEVKELSDDIAHYAEKIDPDPKRKQILEDKLNAIRKLMLKHGAQDEPTLLAIQTALSGQVARWTNMDADILQLETEVEKQKKYLEETAEKISRARKKGATQLAQRVTTNLQSLAMKNAVLAIRVSPSENLHRLGKDHVEFLFTANLGSEPKPVGKVASGGELSRLNLCLKSVVSDQVELPVLVFDEIDSGVSGEIALRMGSMLRLLSQRHQVIMITHSPQIAAQAGHHLQVYKAVHKGKSIAHVRILPPEERITEIAKMLSGDPPTQAAILNAKTLIQHD